MFNPAAQRTCTVSTVSRWMHKFSFTNSVSAQIWSRYPLPVLSHGVDSWPSKCFCSDFSVKLTIDPSLIKSNHFIIYPIRALFEICHSESMNSWVLTSKKCFWGQSDLDLRSVHPWVTVFLRYKIHKCGTFVQMDKLQGWRHNEKHFGIHTKKN